MLYPVLFIDVHADNVNLLGEDTVNTKQNNAEIRSQVTEEIVGLKLNVDKEVPGTTHKAYFPTAQTSSPTIISR
jgi:hypothetical protein